MERPLNPEITIMDLVFLYMKENVGMSLDTNVFLQNNNITHQEFDSAEESLIEFHKEECKIGFLYTSPEILEWNKDSERFVYNWGSFDEYYNLVTVGRTDDPDPKFHAQHRRTTAYKLARDSRLWEIIDDPKKPGEYPKVQLEGLDKSKSNDNGRQDRSIIVKIISIVWMFVKSAWKIILVIAVLLGIYSNWDIVIDLKKKALKFKDTITTQ